MTYGEYQELRRNSKHDTIGTVEIYIKTGKKFDHLDVWYKSGRRYRFNKKENIPDTVMDFLHKQNRHMVHKYPAGIVVTYFMT